MTKAEVSQVVFMLLAAYPNGEKVRDETVEVYEQLLQDLDFESAKAAVVRVGQTHRFLPTVAEIRAVERDLRLGARRTGMEAWGDVTRAISAIGSYRTPVFDDPAVAKVVACMGWRELCLGDNESALRARFIEAYEAISDRELREQAVSEPLRLKAPERGARELNGAATAGYLTGGK